MTWTSEPGIRRRAVAGCVLLAFAVGLGEVAGSSSGAIAIGVCLLGFAPVLLLRAEWAALLAVALLPLFLSVLAGGYAVGVTDLLLALVLAGWLLRCAGDRADRAQLAALRPFAAPLGIYFAVAVFTSSAHLTLAGIVALIQRGEVVAVAMVAGVVLVHRGLARAALIAFVASAVLLSVLWTLRGGQPLILAGQKNPAGGYLVDAILVGLVLTRNRPGRLLLFVVLVIGAYSTQSRGALLGLLVGLVVLFALRTRDPLQIIVQTVGIAVICLGVYAALPSSAQDRLRGDTTTTRYNDQLRRSYAIDAGRIIAANRVVGVGIGNYHAGELSDLTETDDPHNVILLEAAEGGYALPVAFGVLQLGALAVILRRRRSNPWAAPACAVQAAIITHSFVDVYWVRGTPVLGWVLIGMAAAESLRRSQLPQPVAEPVSAP